MKCSCGFDNPPNRLFCPVCGNELQKKTVDSGHRNGSNRLTTTGKGRFRTTASARSTHATTSRKYPLLDLNLSHWKIWSGRHKIGVTLIFLFVMALPFSSETKTGTSIHSGHARQAKPTSTTLYVEPEPTFQTTTTSNPAAYWVATKFQQPWNQFSNEWQGFENVWNTMYGGYKSRTTISDSAKNMLDELVGYIPSDSPNPRLNSAIQDLQLEVSLFLWGKDFGPEPVTWLEDKIARVQRLSH